MRRESHSKNIFTILNSRELNFSLGSFHSKVNNFSIKSNFLTKPTRKDETYPRNEFKMELESLPYVIKHNQNSYTKNMFVIGDEDGLIQIYDMNKFKNKSNECSLKMISAHRNAIFDVAWSKNDEYILSASGDHSVKAWDVQNETCISKSEGHFGSVKSLSVNPSNPNLFSSGGRDGCILFWDLRIKNSNRNAIASIPDAHFPISFRKSPRRKFLQGTRNKSVTALLFLFDGQVIASGGASEKSVKFWDTRNISHPFQIHSNNISSEKYDFNMKEQSSNVGIISLSNDSNCSRLIASSTNNKIYLYDTMKLDKNYFKIFEGFGMSTFHSKSILSPDGNYILSSSRDGCVYIWNVNFEKRNLKIIECRDVETTGLSLDKTDPSLLFSIGDDSTVKMNDIFESLDFFEYFDFVNDGSNSNQKDGDREEEEEDEDIRKRIKREKGKEGEEEKEKENEEENEENENENEKGKRKGKEIKRGNEKGKEIGGRKLEERKLDKNENENEIMDKNSKVVPITTNNMARKTNTLFNYFHIK